MTLDSSDRRPAPSRPLPNDAAHVCWPDIATASPAVPSGDEIRRNVAKAVRLIEEMTMVLLCAPGEKERIEALLGQVRATGPCVPTEVHESELVPAGQVYAMRKAAEPINLGRSERGEEPNTERGSE